VAAEAPDYLQLERHRDWQGRRLDAVIARAGLALICVIPVLGLLDVFGQSPSVKTVADPAGAVTLQLSAPASVRGGLLFEARFDIRAKQGIKNAVLVLDSGWNEAMSMNTIEPGATSEVSRNGSLALTLGKIPAGKLWREYIQFQANPVNSGSQSQGVTLYDGNVELLHLNRTLKVWP
jgi:hypothetical protein